MKKILMNISCVLLGMLALAGETALLLYTRQSYISAKRQAYASELKDVAVRLSASIRMGETERFEEALAEFDNNMDGISPYLQEDEKLRLANYRAAMDNPDTKELMMLNGVLLKLKASLKEPQEIEGLGNRPELAKINETLLKLKGCEVYCSAKDYREIESALKEESAVLNQKLEAAEQESASRLNSEEMITWLDMLK